MSSNEEVRGPVILRQKPRHQLVDAHAYAIPPAATDADFFGAAAWVTSRGGQVKVCDSEGLLVVSTYTDGGRWHEWVSSDSLLMHDIDTNEFTVYGARMADYYAPEPNPPREESDMNMADIEVGS